MRIFLDLAVNSASAGGLASTKGKRIGAFLNVFCAFLGVFMSVLQKIRSNFFDVSPDGTLVYTDPSIGPLHSPRRKLTVRMNESKSCLELTLNGQVCEDFNLNLGAVKACKDAFGAYFKMIEDLRMDAEAEAAVA